MLMLYIVPKTRKKKNTGAIKAQTHEHRTPFMSTDLLNCVLTKITGGGIRTQYQCKTSPMLCQWAKAGKDGKLLTNKHS
jgi:hypothetical protein